MNDTGLNRNRERGPRIYPAALIVGAAIFLAALPAAAQDRTIESTIGLNSFQSDWIQGRIAQGLTRDIRKVKIRTLDDAAIYKELIDGTLDMGSVLLRPSDVGIKDFDASFKTPPQVTTLGHLSVAVLTGSKSGIKQVSVSQVGQLIAGKITTAEALGGTGGKLDVAVDRLALDLICTLTGVTPAAPFKSSPRNADYAAWSALHWARQDRPWIALSATFVPQPPQVSPIPFVVVPVSGEKPGAVIPTLDAVRDGSYPLARPWRLIVRPGSPDIAARAAEAVLSSADHEHLDMSAAHSLVAPASSEVPATVRIGSTGWTEHLEAAAEAYKRKHPEISFTFVTVDAEIVPAFRNGTVDMLAYHGFVSDRMDRKTAEKFDEALGGRPAERTIAWWPFAVLVHPKNPIRSLTLEQVKTLFTAHALSWKDLGRPAEDEIHQYCDQDDRVAQAIYGYDFAAHVNKGPRPLAEKESALDWRPRYRFPPDRDFAKALVGDENAVGILYLTEPLAASGLKVLPISAGAGRAGVRPDDLPAVASGRYVLRSPLNVMVHPKASKAAGDFVEWLATSEEAASAIHHLKSRWGFVVAHVLLAGKDQPDVKPAVPAVPETGATFTGPIDGAVAILPTEPLSMYFLMAGAAEHAEYERAIVEAVAADRRLKIVDRALLARVLDERKLEWMGLQEPASKTPFIAADIFLLSHVVTEDTKSFLRIMAFHGPTAGVMGELKLPIDPANPAEFDPPIQQQVARWWPGVLRQLAASRSKPVWTLVDVYAGRAQVLSEAGQARQALVDAMTADSRVFFVDSSPFVRSQQEVLMRLMGLSAPQSGPFTPAADYVLEGCVTQTGKLELRIRGANLSVIEQTTVERENPGEMNKAAVEWIRSQVARYPGKPAPDGGASTAPDDAWAKAQARLEYDLYKSFRAQFEKRRTEAQSKPAGLHGNPPAEDRNEMDRLERLSMQHLQRAVQLDPAWDEPAYWICRVGGWRASDFDWGHPSVNLFAISKRGADAAQRFIDSFPRSPWREEVLVYLTMDCKQVAGKVRQFPPGLDGRRLQIAYLKQGLRTIEIYRDEFGWGPKCRGKSSMRIYADFEGYLFLLNNYLTLAKPDGSEIEVIVADWSRRWDDKPEQVAHSDFLRLMVLCHKRDHAGFLALLGKMQERWPDPKHFQWQRMGDQVDGWIFRLFNVDSGSSSFQIWKRGVGKIGNLPCAGYDPVKHNRRLQSE